MDKNIHITNLANISLKFKLYKYIAGYFGLEKSFYTYRKITHQEIVNARSWRIKAA